MPIVDQSIALRAPSAVVTDSSVVTDGSVVERTEPSLPLTLPHPTPPYSIPLSLHPYLYLSYPPAHTQVAYLTERVLRQLGALRSRLINPDFGRPPAAEEGTDETFTISGYYGKLYPLRLSHILLYSVLTVRSNQSNRHRAAALCGY